MDALQFILAFAPIISKAAMQTYYSALPLMPSGSLLSKKYSAISRPNLKLSESSYLRIVNHPQVDLPKLRYCSTSSDDIIALYLSEGGTAFFDTRTGNEIGSRIPNRAQDHGYCLFAFSPDGKWIAIEGDYKPSWSHVFGLWNVETRTRVKTIEIESFGFTYSWITYSADGEKVVLVRYGLAIFIWDVKTDEPLKKLEVEAYGAALSPDGSQIAIQEMSPGSIKIIDVSTGHIDRQITLFNGSLWTDDDPIPRIAWSPNGQFLASATMKHSRTQLHLISLTRGSAQVPVLPLECPATKYVSELAISPDSSKIVAALWDFEELGMTFSIWCTRSGALVGTSCNMSIISPALSFAADRQDILICGPSTQNSTLYRFSVVPSHLETYMNDPPKFHPSQTPHTIQYSHHISRAIDDYASHVSADGWILNTKGEREIWTPWANYELLYSCKPPQKGQTQYGTLEVKDPQTKTVVMIYIFAFEQEDVSNGF